MNSDVVSEKLTYARLYPEYNWIVAMGVHLDDISSYVSAATTESRENSLWMLMSLIGVQKGFRQWLIFGVNCDCVKLMKGLNFV